MKARFFTRLILILLVLMSFESFAMRRDSGLWLAVSGKYSFNHKWSGFVGSEFRTYSDLKKFNQVLFHAGVLYDFNDHFQIGSGLTYMGTNRSTLMDEVRPWQNVSYKLKREHFSFKLREQIEERIYPGFNEKFAVRFRTLVGAKFPLGSAKKFALAVSDEMFLNSNSTDWGSNTPLDQNRFKAGVEYSGLAHTNLGVYYMNQHLFFDSAPDICNHLLVLQAAFF